MNMMASRSEVYFDKAYEFIPDRWNRKKPLGEINPYVSLPFSHGTRICVGKRIAEQEIFTFLIRVKTIFMIFNINVYKITNTLY